MFLFALLFSLSVILVVWLVSYLQLVSFLLGRFALSVKQTNCLENQKIDFLCPLLFLLHVQLPVRFVQGPFDFMQ